MSTEQKTRYTLKATRTPLPSAGKKQVDEEKGQTNKNDLRLSQNEDDDLYDPYTDYHDGTLGKQTFEEDPWK